MPNRLCCACWAGLPTGQAQLSQPKQSVSHGLPFRRLALHPSSAPNNTPLPINIAAPFWQSLGDDGLAGARSRLSWKSSRLVVSALLLGHTIPTHSFCILSTALSNQRHDSRSSSHGRHSTPGMHATTMLSDRDPNGGGGRTSRASNMSAMSRTSGPFPHHTAKPDLLSAAGPGVMSMLRTSTEMGNVVGLTGGESAGIGSLSRAPQRRGASSRLSTASSVSNHSSRASRHHRQWPSSSSAARWSSTREPPPMGPQYVADTLSPTLMNIPGSSPLVPRARDRDSHRSLSMTHASQPVYRLSSNRSLGSLRHEQIQRPKSPYVYPTRLRRPSYRPESPALSDVSATAHPRRAHGYGGPGGSSYYPQQYASGYPGSYSGQQRHRMPSDASLGQQDRIPHGPPRRPSRGPSPVYYSGPRTEMPPMPVGYQHHIAVEQARMLNRSLKGSMSSSSTNLRTDSDAPSSDMASPPTPKEGASMEVLFGPEGARVNVDGSHGVHGVAKGQCYSRPLYFDGTEQFEREPYPPEPETDAVPTGFVARYTTIVEERGSPDTVPIAHAPPKTKISLEVVRSSEMAGMAELPASPVPRRITRGQILKALEPASTTGEMTSPVPSSVLKGGPGSLHSDDLPAMTSPGNDEPAEASLHPRDRQDHRHSILSQTGSSLLDSSTLEFAVRYSIPMATGAGFGTASTSVPGNGPSTSASPEKSTEDGMSELLAGYQHTESKHSADVVSQHVLTPEKAAAAEKPVKKSEQGPRSSDELSFKSCTDLPEASSEPATPAHNKDCRDAESIKSAVVDPRDPSMKDADARSFSTAKVTVTPDHTASMPHARLPSSGLATSVPLFNRPVSETPLSSPSPAAVLLLRKEAPASLRESSLSVMASKLRASSKPSAKPSSSISVSMSGSSSTLSATQQPPAVPPRESSSSKEAQRYQAVASFLMRQLPSRRARSWKQAKDADDVKASPTKQEARDSIQGKQEPSGVPAPSELPVHGIKTPDRALVQPSGLSRKEGDSSVSVSNSNRIPSRASVNESMALEQPQPATSSSFPLYQEPSSVYSPQDASLQFRTHSSPADVPSSPDHACRENRRESQTTTHLVWPGRKSFNLHSASVSEPHLPLSDIQENTTTDLRLSGYGYKYSGPAQHLPDLKEESHEDSSLNTSASNLKHSNFRFPLGPLPVLQASVDDPVTAPQRLSTGSHRQSNISGALGRTHGLPSMHFSQMNLFEKLNEELGLRDSRSLEDGGKDSDKLGNDSPWRPASASQVREKFRSLVAGLDRLDRVEGKVPPEDKVNSVVSKRCRSPEQLIAEIDGLTIPSVGGLTQRISELLPSLREYYHLGEQGEFAEEEVIIEKAMQKLAEVAPTQKRSSARLRPMPGSPHMVVVDDAVFEELTGIDKESGSPDRGADRRVVEGSSEGGGPGAKPSGDNVIHQQAQEGTSIVELQAPSPARIRPRSHTIGPHKLRASGESDLSSRRSLPSVVTTTPTATDTRPWNSDKNFPWASTTLPSFDISLPSPAAVRHSPRPGPSHLRNRLSEACSTSSFSSGQTATASPFGSTGTSNAHAHHHRFSVFGRSRDQPHAVGERYPTSALTPPTAIFRDHFTASETSDDEDFNPSRKSRRGLRKRFSSARSAAVDQSNRLSRSKTNPQELASPESDKPAATLLLPEHSSEAAAFTSHRHTFRDAEGMRGVEYHRQRLVDRLKRWWHKGGNLIRTISGRKQRALNSY